MTHIVGACVNISLCIAVPVAHVESWTLTRLLTPNCMGHAEVVWDVAACVRRPPEVQSGDVLLVEWLDLGVILPQVQMMAGQGIPCVVEAAGVTRAALTEAPALLVQRGERTIRVTGRPDMERIWSH